MGYIFGGNTNETPESLARKRRLIDELTGGIGRAQNVGQGIGDILRGVGAGLARYRADKSEGLGRAEADKAWSAFNPFPSAPPVAGQQTQMRTPAPKQDFGGYSGIPATTGVPSAALQQQQQPTSGNILPASFSTAVDKYEGAGGYDTLFGHAQNKGQFAGTKVSEMTVGQAMQFSDAGGAYGQSVKGQIGRVATPMGRYQIVGKTLRSAVQELGLDPNTPFNQRTQDQIAMHLAKKRVGSADTMGGKIAALRNEWAGFKNVPDNQLAQIVQEISSGGGAVPQSGGNVPRETNPRTDNSRLSELGQLLSNPWLDENKKAMVKQLYDQEMQKSDPAYQMKMQGGQIDLEKSRLELEQMQNPSIDPMKQIQLEQERIKLQQMQNPAPDKPLVLGDGARVYDPVTRQIIMDQAPRQSPKPAGIQEYEYAKQQGFKGTFQDWEASKKGGMSLQTNPDGTVSFQQGMGNIKPMTEAQSKDTVFSTRAKGALAVFDQIESGMTGVGGVVGNTVGQLPGVGNFLKSDGYQQAEQSGNEFLQAVLRKDTGAAITPGEQALYGSTYLPKPGDSDVVISQKRAARARAVAAIEAGMTPQAILAQEQALARGGKQGVAPKPPSVAPQIQPEPQVPTDLYKSGLPPGAVQDLLADPSPESQAMFDEIFGAGAARRALSGQ